MTEKPKDYTSTIMRMAGNIAPAMIAPWQGVWDVKEIAGLSVDLAEAIVNEVLSRSTKESDD